MGLSRMGFETSFDVKRADFDMNFMSDKVGNVVSVDLAVEGTKK